MATATKDYKPKATDKIVALTDRADFKAEYPKDYKGAKHMKDGKVYERLHIDHAKYLQDDLKVGKIIKEYSVKPKDNDTD